MYSTGHSLAPSAAQAAPRQTAAEPGPHQPLAVHDQEQLNADKFVAQGGFNVAQAKSQVLRVKRRLDSSAPEQIILEAAPSSKRLKNDAIASQLSGMSIGAQTSNRSAAVDAKQRRRFLRISTMSPALLQVRSQLYLLHLSKRFLTDESVVSGCLAGSPIQQSCRPTFRNSSTGFTSANAAEHSTAFLPKAFI